MSAFVVGASLLLVAGCSGSGSAKETGAGIAPEALAKAQAVVDSASKEITTWNGPTSSPPPAAKKKIGIIPCSQKAVGCVREATGAEEAAKALGWETVVLDGQSDAQHQMAAMNSLMDQGVDAIVLGSFDPAVVGDGMRRAKEMGVAVVGCTIPDPTQYGGLAGLAPDEEAAGRVLGAYITVNGGGKVAAFDQQENRSVALRLVGLRESLKEYGGSNIIYDQTVAMAQIGAEEESIMTALLQSHPVGQIDWIAAGFDVELTPLIQSAVRAGRTELKAVAVDGNLENIDFIRKGDNLQVATVAYPLEWTGWAAVDDLNRHFNQQAVVAQNIPFRLLTKANLPPAGSSWDGDYNFRAKYKELWGVK